MSDKFEILVAEKKSLKKIFSDELFTSNFNITFCADEDAFISRIDSGLQTDAIVIENSFAKDNDFDLIKKIDKKTTLQAALKSDLITKVPIIVLLDLDDENLGINLLEQNVTDVFPINSPKQIIFFKIKNIMQNSKLDSERFTILNNQHKSAIQRLSQLSDKAGIYNRKTFIEKTKEFFNSSSKEDFIFIRFDLDRFKVFNDLFGFEEGDKILRKIGEWLLIPQDIKFTFGHVHADHFIICAEKSELNPQIFLKKITDFVNSIYPSFDFIVRMGVYETSNKRDVNVNLAIDRSLLALNSIKQNFTERIGFYKNSMLNDLKEEQELITDMVTGLNNHEFKVYIQPQYDYTTDSLTGAEALVRWQHPKKGLISPTIFIPIFEKNGFITQLDQYIWEETCRLLRKWIDEGLNPVPVSVNISRRDIYNTDLSEIFKNLLLKYNLTPDLLRLEITESAYMDNPDQLIRVVENLRNQGFCLEMDDFGSGYSSLNTLKEVPVDILKLDMKFIAESTPDLENNKFSESAAKSGSILSSVVRMANWLHLPVIAEGIESKSQADYLKSIGCFHMQGFYFARPMPSDEYRNLLYTLNPVCKDEDSSSDITPAVNFLDTTTQDSLLFNKFVGAAAIIEWTGDCIEIIRMNDQYLEEMGTTQEKYSTFHKNLLEHIEESSRPILLSMLADATKTKKTEFCEIKSLPLYEGNRPFWIRTKARQLAKTATSDIFYITIENIDFRMQLLQLNTNLSEQLSTIMENVPCGIITLDYDGTFKTSYLNENTASLGGFDQSEFRSKIGKDPFLMFHENDREHYKEYLLNILHSKLPAFNSKARFLCKNGNTKTVQIAGNLLERSDGSFYISCVIVDINELEKHNLSKYVNFVYTLFNEIYELDYKNNKSTTLKSSFSLEQVNETRNLQESYNKWADKFVIEEDREKFKRFISPEHINNLNDELSVCHFSIKNQQEQIKNIRGVLIPNGEGKYLYCCGINPVSE